MLIEMSWQLRPLPQQQTLLHNPLLLSPKRMSSLSRTTKYAHLSLPHYCSRKTTISAISIKQLPPNARRQKNDPDWDGGFSLGLDLGLARTGLALSKGFAVRPLSVLELRGEKFDKRVMEIAEKEEVDEFIIGLPVSADGEETPQSNKVRSVAGRLAVLAAQRGWRVYLMDEHGTSAEALDRMIDIGLKRSARQSKIDVYAAVMILERYFSMSGHGTELVLPRNLDLQEKLLRGPPKDLDF